MNLLDLAVKITCDDQASGEVSGIAQSIKGGLASAAKVGAAAVAAVGTATVAMGKTALDAYANYEQLVGGIDTLFKGASGTVQKYAAEAYKTAGTSANQYMEIVTSFSASLINSLGGDTAKAAEYANMAISDMSDNANKMGTDLEMIQETYQSIARGNYEMLDNLKLGYAGTKAGLEDLLADAEKYAAKNGEIRDFSVDSYADIVEAIHIVQEEMGITGTTAEEAATTIQGSINMAKAAWENWLTGLGNEDADMSKLTEDLVESLMTAFDNVVPRIGIIMGTLGETIVEYAPQIGQNLADFIVQGFVDAFNAISTIIGENTVLPTVQIDTEDAINALNTLRETIQSVFEGVQEIGGQVAEALAPGFESLSETVGVVGSALSEAFGPAVQEGLSLIAPLAEQVGQFMEHMGTQISEVLVPAIEPLGEAFTNFFSALEPWLEPLENVAELFGNILVAAITAFASALTFVIEVVTTVLNAIMDFDAFLNGEPSSIGNVITAIINWFAQLPGNIWNFLSTVISNVISWVSSMASNAVQAGSQFLSNVVSFFTQLPGKVASFLSNVISRVGSWVGEMASKAVEAASEFGSSLIDGLQSIPGQVYDIGTQIINGIKDGITGAAQNLIDAASGAVNDAINAAKNLLGIASPSKVFRAFGRYMMEGAALGVDDEKDMPVKSVRSAMDEVVNAAEDYGIDGVPYGSRGGRGGITIVIDGSIARVDSRIEDKMNDFVDTVLSTNRMRRVAANG